MTGKTTIDKQAAHKQFSASCFNEAWDFIDKQNRSREDELNMLLAAMASLWHWKQRPDTSATNLSVGFWQVSRVYCLLGETENARKYGLLSLEESRKEEVAPFYLGYSYEALARAAALAGDREKMGEYLNLARDACEQVKDEDSRKMLLDDLATILLH